MKGRAWIALSLGLFKALPLARAECTGVPFSEPLRNRLYFSAVIKFGVGRS